jgi:glycosyltransferase involved in cell wall biosynthesis
MKIAHVIARLNVGGPAVAVITAVDELSRRGHDVLLLCGEVPPSEASMEYLAREQNVSLTRISRMSRRISLWKDLASFVRLCRIFRRERPQIVHTHTAKAGTLGRLAAMCMRVPVRIHVFHGHVFRGYFSPPTTKVVIAIERWLARHTDCIIALSEAQRHELVEIFHIAPAEKVSIVPLGFALERYLDAGISKSHTPGGHESPLIGWVGRLTAIKDPEVFIQSAAATRLRWPDSRYVLVGDGELREACEDSIRTLALDGHVSILGWQRQLESIYSSLDMLVLTSINEGTPLVMLEAMASGRPVIAVDVGGVRDLMVGSALPYGGLQVFENGVLAARDANSIANAISYLLEHPELRERMGYAGREFVRDRFSRKRMVCDLEALYLQSLEAKLTDRKPAGAAEAAKAIIHS